MWWISNLSMRFWNVDSIAFLIFKAHTDSFWLGQTVLIWPSWNENLLNDLFYYSIYYILCLCTFFFEYNWFRSSLLVFNLKFNEIHTYTNYKENIYWKLLRSQDKFLLIDDKLLEDLNIYTVTPSWILFCN